MKQLFTNNAVSLLALPITSSDTALTVMTGYGLLFPNPGPNEYFLVTLENETATAREIIRVTGRTGDTFTFSLSDRAQEGTIAQGWGASFGNDTLVDHRLTAETLEVAVEADWIQGANTGTLITPASTSTINAVNYSNLNRGFKFFVTVLNTSTENAATLEILANVSGSLSLNTETIEWNTVGRIGFLLNFTIFISLNTSSKDLELKVANGEPNPIQVMCTRIQHGT